MIRVRHIEHKYNRTGANSFLKKGAGVTGAIINQLASENQKRRINYKKSVFYHKHNQNLPEDVAIMWDQKLIEML